MAMALQPWAIGLNPETGEDENLLSILANRRKTAAREALTPGMKEILAKNTATGARGAAVAGMGALSGLAQGMFNRQDAAREMQLRQSQAVSAAEFLRKSDPRFAKYPPGVLEKALYDNPALITTLTGKAFEQTSWTVGTRKVKDKFGNESEEQFLYDPKNPGRTLPYPSAPGGAAAPAPPPAATTPAPTPTPTPEQTPPAPQGEATPGLPTGYRTVGPNQFVGPDGKPVRPQDIPKQPIGSTTPLTPAVNPPVDAPVKLPANRQQLGQAPVIPGPDGIIQQASLGGGDAAPPVYSGPGFRGMGGLLPDSPAGGPVVQAAAQSPRMGTGVPPLPPQGSYGGALPPAVAPQPQPQPQPQPAMTLPPGVTQRGGRFFGPGGQELDPVQLAKDASKAESRRVFGAPQEEVAGMRKEYGNIQEVKDYEKSRYTFDSLKKMANSNTRAGDMNLIYAVATMMDPTSVVRESDALAVKNTQGLSSFLQNIISQFNSKSEISREAKQYLMDEMYKRMQPLEAAQQQNADFYTQAARSAQINPAQVVPPRENVMPWIAEHAPTKAPLMEPALLPSGAVNPKAGQILVDEQGQWKADERLAAENPPLPPERPQEFAAPRMTPAQEADAMLQYREQMRLMNEDAARWRAARGM